MIERTLLITTLLGDMSIHVPWLSTLTRPDSGFDKKYVSRYNSIILQIITFKEYLPSIYMTFSKSPILEYG
jgi:hypothetical protein